MPIAAVYIITSSWQQVLLLLLNVFDDAPVCRHVKDESWAHDTHTSKLLSAEKVSVHPSVCVYACV